MVWLYLDGNESYRIRAANSWLFLILNTLPHHAEQSLGRKRKEGRKEVTGTVPKEGSVQHTSRRMCAVVTDTDQGSIIRACP